MGDTHSKHARRKSVKEQVINPSENTENTAATSDAVAATAVVAVTVSGGPPAADPPPSKCDVLISSTCGEDDLLLSQQIKDGLKNVEISVFISTDQSSEAAKTAAKLLVDAKCVIYIASKEAAMNNVGQDLISLAYISNKHILVVAQETKASLLKEFIVGMKMTLNQLQWSVFDDKEKQDMYLKTFIQLIQDHLSNKSHAEDSIGDDYYSSAFITRRGGRLNTKLRSQSTIRDIGGEDLQIMNFWDRNFPNEEEVPWFKFQKCFLNDYEIQLAGLFDDENVPWLLDMLHCDVFENVEKITKDHFFQVRGDSRENNQFWKVVSQIAVEKFNIKEVFNMKSSVRLAAIERLAAFQNPAVVGALLKLMEDVDPNVRAVAAISLGRTGCSEEFVIDHLIALLKDGDRIVRQSACLSLGALKAVKAIPHIGNIWRNDFISVVRNAARTALENMDIPEAKQVLSVTKVLEDEIATLAGNQAAV